MIRAVIVSNSPFSYHLFCKLLSTSNAFNVRTLKMCEIKPYYHICDIYMLNKPQNIIIYYRIYWSVEYKNKITSNNNSAMFSICCTSFSEIPHITYIKYAITVYEKELAKLFMCTLIESTMIAMKKFP
jgi:hypothetical protein